MVNAILLPALFVVLIAERLFLAEADRLDAVDRHPRCTKACLCRFCPARSEGVLDGSPVVTMPFDENLNIWVLCEKGSIVLDRGHLIRTNS